MNSEEKEQLVEQELPEERAEKPGAYLQLDIFLPSVIRNLAEGITRSMSRRYTGDFQLTVTEWRIILLLASKAPLTATAVVDHTAMEKSKVSRAVSNLEERGFVSRTPLESDHRTKALGLTEHGQHLYTSIVPRVLGWEKLLLEGLELSEYRDLLYLLNKLQTRLKTMEQEFETQQREG